MAAATPTKQQQSAFTTPTKKIGKDRTDLSLTAAATGLANLHNNLFVPSNIKMTEIYLPWFKKSQQPTAFTLDNVFTPQECKSFIDATEKVGYGQALVNYGYGRQVLKPDVRNNTRCMIDDAKIAAIMFERIKSFLPQTWIDNYTQTQSTVVSLNERLRFLKYTPGQHFAPHYDGSFERATPNEGYELPERSFITFQLYLNSGDGQDFEGGSTAFLDHTKWSEQPEDFVHCHAKVGRVLIFEHHLLHQGSKVTAGTKYCVRSDIMYQPERLQGGKNQNGNGSVVPMEPDHYPTEAPIDVPQ